MRKLWWAVGAALVVVAIAVWWANGGQGWLAYQTGTRCGSTGDQYCYWSGFGSVFPWSLLALSGIVSGVLLLWRSRTCHRYWWCWRHPRHPLEGNEHYLLCSRHHPDDQMSVVEAVGHHRRLKRSRDPR